MVGRRELSGSCFDSAARLASYAAALMRESAPASDILRSSGVDPTSLTGLMPHVDPTTVRVKVASAWFRRFWAKGIAAVALPTGVFVRPGVMERFRSGAEPERSGRLIVHELMHIEQWRRLGAVRHITQYVGDYLRHRLRGFGHWEAYRAVRLEQEARAAASSVKFGGPR